jgi:hypothetical protein
VSDIKATSVVVMMWHIWDVWNKFREEGIMAHPNSIAAKVKAYIEMILVHLYRPIPNTGASLLLRLQNGLHRW